MFPGASENAARKRRFAWRGSCAALTATFLIALSPPLSAQDRGEGDEHVAISASGGVELHVADMPLADVLQLLSLESKRNIVASPNVTGTVTADLYDVTFEEALHAILATNGAGFRKVGKFIYINTKEELAELEKAKSDKPITRVFHLNYVASKDAEAYVQPLLGEGEGVSVSPEPQSGLASEADQGGGQSYASGDFIVVTARTGTLARIKTLLREIDIRPRQVLVEATILRAELTDQNSLGIDFSIVGGVDLARLGASSNGIQDITLGSLPQDRFEAMNAIATTDFISTLPDGGLTFGVIKDNVAVFLRALEQVTDTTVLANPKILTLNRQKAQVIVGRRDGFLTTTVTETQAIQTVEFLETGTQLVFRPFIGNDGWVRLELHPEDSVGFVNAQGLPSEQTTEVTTNVMVRDGETILIAGLFREVTTNTRSQVPGLGNAPGIGQLFRANDESTRREEIIILLTVHIVKDQDRYADASREAWEDIERVRVGLRRGMLSLGRNRLAQSHYQRAIAAYRSADSDRALWHLDLALRNNGQLLPAIKLKEQILQARAWDEDGSAARSLIHDLIAAERGYPTPHFGRPTAPGSAPQDEEQREDD